MVEPPDLLQVEVLDALPGRPISGERLVRPDGKISLGWYGELYVAGKTVRQIKADIVIHLRKFLCDEQLGLVLYETEVDAPVKDPKTGEPKLIDPRESDRVFVDVLAYNSKNYYIEGEVRSPGHLPVTGQERILDAIDFADGLTPEADHEQVFLYRQTPARGAVQTLKIDIDQIMLGDDMSTNYQLLAGDKLVVRRRGGDAVKNDSRKPKEKPAPAERGKRRANGENTAIARLEELALTAMEQKLDRILDSRERADH